MGFVWMFFCCFLSFFLEWKVRSCGLVVRSWFRGDLFVGLALFRVGLWFVIFSNGNTEVGAWFGWFLG